MALVFSEICIINNALNRYARQTALACGDAETAGLGRIALRPQEVSQASIFCNRVYPIGRKSLWLWPLHTLAV